MAVSPLAWIRAAVRDHVPHRGAAQWWGVATNRTAVGRRSGGRGCLLTRWLTVRLVGLVFLIAFASLLVQVDGLVGRGGIMPAAEFMDALATRGVEWTQAPTLAWLDITDRALRWGCIGGMVLAAGIIVRVMPAAVSARVVGPVLVLCHHLCPISQFPVGHVSAGDGGFCVSSSSRGIGGPGWLQTAPPGVGGLDAARLACSSS